MNKTLIMKQLEFMEIFTDIEPYIEKMRQDVLNNLKKSGQVGKALVFAVNYPERIQDTYNLPKNM